MVDTARWADLVIDIVEDVHLDPQNVRLEVSDGVPESDIIQDLFSNEKALGIVEAVTKIGWLSHELPIVVVRDGKYTVVEGNRRIAALKAIQNPYLVPDFQARISKLVQSSVVPLDRLKKIPVKVATNQEEADQVVAALHTGSQRVAWGPSRQAAFFQAQIDAGKSPQQLIAQYPLIDVMKFVTRSRILELFRNVEYQNDALKDYVRHRRKFKVSTLARLYNNDEFLEIAGITIDESAGTATCSRPSLVFRDLAEKIISDIHLGRINTRVLNKSDSESFKDYIAELKSTLDVALSNEDERERKISDAYKQPNGDTRSQRRAAETGTGTRGGGSGGSNEETNGGTTGGRDGRGKPGAPPNTTDKPEPKKPKLKYLSMDNITPATNRPISVQAIRTELGALDFERFPNATLDLLRTFLEKSIKAYAESLGVEIRDHVSVNGFVYLSHCLQWLEGHFKSDPNNKALVQVAQKIRTNKLSSYAATSDHLNAVNHNHKISVTASDVRDAWDVVAPLLEVIVK